MVMTRARYIRRTTEGRSLRPVSHLLFTNTGLCKNGVCPAGSNIITVYRRCSTRGNSSVRSLYAVPNLLYSRTSYGYLHHNRRVNGRTVRHSARVCSTG